jgi:hypothetical protein
MRAFFVPEAPGDYGSWGVLWWGFRQVSMQGVCWESSVLNCLLDGEAYEITNRPRG